MGDTKKLRFGGCTPHQQSYRSFADHGVLVRGESYQLRLIRVQGDYTQIYLWEVPDKPFNSVCFVTEDGDTLESLIQFTSKHGTQVKKDPGNRARA